MTREEAIRQLDGADVAVLNRDFFMFNQAIIMAILDLRQQECVGEANEALTLDELRKMDGEPVWVRSIDGDGKNIWAFIDTDCEMVRIFATKSSVKCMVTLRHFKTYGKSWLAYRQKPSEETK